MRGFGGVDNYHFVIVNTLLPDTLVIAFGHKSGQGKDTAATAIIDKYGQVYDVRRYAFADAVKIEFYDALLNPINDYWAFARDTNYLAIPHPRVVFCSDQDKRDWIDIHKAELGGHLQSYGTDFRRASHPYYWISALRTAIELEKPKVALITDLRMPNEVQFVQACKGYTVKVVRDGYRNPNRPGDHPSETLLNDFMFDYEIHTSAYDLETLQADACQLFDTIIAAQQPTLPEVTDVLAVRSV
jgi:hypothetical protein